MALATGAWVSATSARATVSPPLHRAVAQASSTLAMYHGRGASARPRPFEVFALSESLRDSIVALALSQLGMPYVLGGATPRRGFDCSGLVRWVAAQVHMPLPRTARMQARIGKPVARARLEPGDLLAFGEGKRVSHVGIYVGGGRFVHASSVAGRVVVSALDRKPSRLIRPMRAARRLLATADQLTGS